MSLQFCFIINVVLLSRLVLIFQDKPVTKSQTIVMMLFHVTGLLVYEMNIKWAVLAVSLIIINVLFHYLENKYKNIDLLRLLSLLAYVIILSILFSPWSGMEFNNRLPKILLNLGYYSSLFIKWSGIDWLKANIHLLGFLLTTNEANILIRFLFNILKMTPKHSSEANRKASDSIDQREYNAGRVIGILERSLIYLFVLNDQYTAIAFILAAKTFTRFKELEKRKLAEYVLIGTLLSTFLAMVITEITKLLLRLP